MRGHVLQERAPQDLVADLGGPLLQQIVGAVQDLSRAGVPVGLQDAIAGQVDPQGLLRAVECRMGFQVAESLLHVSQGLSPLLASQGHTGQAGQRFRGQMRLAQLTPQVQSLPISIGGLAELPQARQCVPQRGQRIPLSRRGPYVLCDL